MKSLRSTEGYFMLDSRNNEGIPDSFVRAMSPELPMSAGRGMFEAPTITCSHCQVVVIINPLRKRERAYCPKCDHYLCDLCGAARALTGECRPFRQIVDEVQEAAALAAQGER